MNNSKAYLLKLRVDDELKGFRRTPCPLLMVSDEVPIM